MFRSFWIENWLGFGSLQNFVQGDVPFSHWSIAQASADLSSLCHVLCDILHSHIFTIVISHPFSQVVAPDRRI